MTQDLLNKLRRGIRKPPHVIIKRIAAEVKVVLTRYSAPLQAKNLNILKETNCSTIDELWQKLAQRPYPAFLQPTLAAAELEYQELCPANREHILTKADDALHHRVNLLGSGLINLGTKINWHKDYKSGFDWPSQYIRDIDYNNPERPSDVKFPWEVSRMQWLIPAGQAYLLTQDEKYAEAVKNILADWIDNNPYAYSINWTCTMEVALRILTWTWFFHVFHNSVAWQETPFRQKFLHALFLHGNFTAKHLEYSDVNGNHYTADAAGLVFAGLFFGTGKLPQHWQKLGWSILESELPRQVFSDGVDFEASVPYHRLVLELFFLPALYREQCNLATPAFYRDRLIAMAHFTAAYSRLDGTVPLWGDADDARALPLGDQVINDHRYLCGLVGVHWQIPELNQACSGSLSEIYWLLGPQATHQLKTTPQRSVQSAGFPEGGFYIMRNDKDHIFIDCGPLGLAGRGGHGHNDCLSFEAILDGEHLISDCGAYLYTASFQERNNFRSTAYHNTPQIDGEEINRFIRWDYLWNLHNDATPSVQKWETNTQRDLFHGSHSGYQRLAQPVVPSRTITLNHQYHCLTIMDEFHGKGEHQITIPLHLAPNVTAELQTTNRWINLESNQKKYLITWESDVDWSVSIESARISPSYGVIVPTQKLIWQTKADGNAKIIIQIAPKP